MNSVNYLQGLVNLRIASLRNSTTLLFFSLLFSFLSEAVNAQTLGQYTFTGLDGCSANSVSSQPAHATFSSYTSVGTTCGFLVGSVFDRYSLNTSGTINTGEYNSFTITPAAGYVLNLTNFTFKHYCSLFSSPNWTLRSSLDNYASNIATGSVSSSSQTPSINLPSGFTNIGAVTFRIYITNANSSLTHWANDNVTVSGSVTLSCTNPATPANPTTNSPQCISSGVTITKSGSAPTGVTWYWQGTNAAGTSTTQNATSTYNATASGTYYVRAQDNTGLCWSASSGSIAVTVNSLPTITLGTNPAVCAGTSTANLSYSATSGSPDKYSIDYDATAEAAGLIDIADATLPASSISIALPPGVAAGTYNYSVLVKNNTTGCNSIGVAKSLTIAAPAMVYGGGPNNALQSTSPSSITLSGASIAGSATTAAWSIISGGGTLSTTSQTSSPQTITYTPAANYSGSVVLRLTTNAGTCPAVGANRIITIDPASTQTFYSNTNFTIPTCITSVNVECWGGGGGGGGNAQVSDGGGGGGGGAYSKSILTVVPGTTYAVNVGAGGTRGSLGADGGNGGDSWFINNTTLLAKGGAKGLKQTGLLGTGGAGGASSSGIGSVKYSGGNGANGNNSLFGAGGGGGASAGTGANGGNASGNDGGAAPSGGGDGGSGAYLSNGNAGTVPGGGGAGSSINLAGFGGDGANGKVVISWSSNLVISGNAQIASGVCANTSNTPIHSFKLEGDNSCVTNLNFLTTGNYTSSEISNFKLYYTTTNSFSTNNLLATISSPAVAGTQSFPAFSLPFSSATKYFWITMDASNTATEGHTISVGGTSASNITASMSATGSANASGTKILKPNASISLTSATGTNNQTVCNAVGIANITYTLGGGGTGALVTGLPSGVTGLFSSGMVTISGTPNVAGTFNYTVNTSGTCTQASATGTIIVNSLPTVSSTISPSATVCVGTSVTMNGEGATSYSWTGGVTNGISFLPALTNTYTISGTDVNGCVNTAIKTITVNELPTVGITASPSSTVCAGSSATLSASGAATYSWSPATGLDATTGGSVTANPAITTTYTVTATNTQGCSNEQYITVAVVTTFNISGEVSDINCTTNALGSIVLTPLCGTAPFTYWWNNGSTTQNISNLHEGVYEVNAVDAAGVRIIKQFRVYTCAEWTDKVTISQSGNSLTKTSINGFGNSGAKSKNLMYQNQSGAIKYVLEDLTKSFIVGLSKEEKYDLLLPNIIAAIGIQGDTLKTFVQGELKNTYGNIKQGDVLELVQSVGKVQFLKNGDTLMTVDSVNFAALKVDFIPYKQNSTVTDIKSTFGLPQTVINTNLLNTKIDNTDSINIQLYLNSTLLSSMISGTKAAFSLPDSFTDTALNYTIILTKEGLRDTKINYVTTKYGTIKSVNYYDDSLNVYVSLDSTLYDVTDDNQLVLVPVNRSVFEIIPEESIYLNLDGGLVLSPDNDGNFDYLTLAGKNEVQLFDIVVYDLQDIVVFHETDKNFAWDGKNLNSQLIKGTYKYQMTVNGEELSGIFLIDFE